MRGRSTFAQVLDEKLRAFESSPDIGLSRAPSRPSGPANPFLFSQPYQSINARCYPPAARHSDARASRSLASHEQHALATLNRLGAGLSADFTMCELRSAFRDLARRYHPDRHPASDDTKRVQLARAFSEIVDHHRQLMKVPLQCPS